MKSKSKMFHVEPEKIVFEDRIEYRLNGEYHREDGPALMWKDGGEVWYRHGKYHREDGPAFIYKDGDEGWYTGGIELTSEDTETAKKILSSEYPFLDLPLLINHPTLKYFALRKLSDHGT